MGYGYGMMGGFGLVVVFVYFAVVAYALYLLTRIADSLRTIAASLERMSSGGPPEK